MAKIKFYAVRVGKTPGIYQTWSQAEEQVKGYSGAEYKSFSTEEEAIKYISGEEINETEQISENTSIINEKIK